MSEFFPMPSPHVRGQKRFEALYIPEPNSGCWFWLGTIDQLGYGRMAILTKSYKAHRLSYMYHRGTIPRGMKVCHICDVRCCVNPDHLFVGTQADNVRDMMKKGRARSVQHFGEANPLAKLTQKQVNAMRTLRAETGLSYSKIAKRYGVSTMTAFRAITGQSWSM